MASDGEGNGQDERDLASIVARGGSRVEFPWTGNPGFDSFLVWMAETHKKKSHDYANDEEPLANFFLQAQMTGLSVDMVFLVALSIKMARLKELIDADKVAKNESIEDTIGDMAVYCGLWSTYRKRTARDF